MPNRASYSIWEGNGFCVFVDGQVVGGTMPERDAKAVVRWLGDGGDKLIPRPRAMNVDETGVLSRDELDVIRKHFADDEFDSVDIGALIDHADAIADSYEDLARRSAEEPDRATALVLRKDEELAAHADLHQQAAHRIEQLVRDLAVQQEATAGAREIIRLALAAMREPLTQTDARRAREILQKYHHECAVAAVRARRETEVARA